MPPAAPAPRGYAEDMRNPTAVLSLAAAAVLSSAVAFAAPDPRVQDEVWKAEEAFVSAQLEHLNEALALGTVMIENWKDVPGDSRASFEQARTLALIERKRLSDVGVTDAQNVFALQGRVPTPEQTKTFLTFRGRTFQMIQASKGLYKELQEDSNRANPLAPPALSEAFKRFFLANRGIVDRLAPLNDQLTGAMREGYTSRWNLWD